MDAKQYTDFDAFREHGEAGAIMLMDHDEHGMMGVSIKCAGCGSESYLPCDHEDRYWTWDGNREAPTLTPSVFHTKEKGGCGWHGYLRNGQWVLA